MNNGELGPARAFLAEHIPPGTRMLCAVSGGLDSMCLLELAGDWGAERGCGVVAAHFHHGLRGANADRDRAFVQSWCEARGLPFVTGTGDTRALAEREGLTPEEAARRLRYAFLERAAAENGCGAILTAHHADDNAETMLLNLVRGTGLKGLRGIPPVRGIICRPFLELTRAELEGYAAARGLAHVEDETNADPAAAARNLLRLQVMPLLRQLNPRVAEAMSRTARQVETADEGLEREALRRTAHARAAEGRAALKLEALREAPPAVRPRMLLRLFELLGAGRRDIGAVHLDALLDMAEHADGRSENRLSLPHGVTARCDRRQWLVLEAQPQAPGEARLLPGRPLRWGGYTLTLLDRREGEGLALRPRREDEEGTVTVGSCPAGAYLSLPGTRGGRSVKRLCLDRRIGLTERDGLPAVYVDGRLAAVWRLGVDTEFLPEGAPCRFIQITKETEGEQG